MYYLFLLISPKITFNLGGKKSLMSANQLDGCLCFQGCHRSSVTLMPNECFLMASIKKVKPVHAVNCISISQVQNTEASLQFNIKQQE